jgi:hypothetical protein
MSNTGSEELNVPGSESAALNIDKVAQHHAGKSRRFFKRFSRRAQVTVSILGSLVAVLMVGTLALAAAPVNPVQNGVINSCYKSANGKDIRFIDPATMNCKADETALQWNQTPDIQYVKTTRTANAFVALDIRAYCPAGKQPISGGYNALIDVNTARNLFITKSSPVLDNLGSGWSVIVSNFNPVGQPTSNANVDVYVICQTLRSGVVPPA